LRSLRLGRAVRKAWVLMFGSQYGGWYNFIVIGRPERVSLDGVLALVIYRLGGNGRAGGREWAVGVPPRR